MPDAEMIFSRRGAMMASAVAGVGIAGAGLVAPQGAAHAESAQARRKPDGTCLTPPSAIAQTQYGPVRGYVSDEVVTFKGVPYGADTGGANRWLPAKPPTRWTAPLNTLAYGANCPQSLHDMRNVEHTFVQQWTDGFLGEDMLKLNIWTGSLSGRKP